MCIDGELMFPCPVQNSVGMFVEMRVRITKYPDEERYSPVVGKRPVELFLAQRLGICNESLCRCTQIISGCFERTIFALLIDPLVFLLHAQACHWVSLVALAICLQIFQHALLPPCQMDNIIFD